jgi:hypothetical protein
VPLSPRCRPTSGAVTGPSCASIGSGDLEASKVDGEWLVDLASVDTYLDKTSNRPSRRRQRDMAR